MSIEYLVETDWAVHWLRGKEDIVAKLKELQPAGIGLSIISLAELYTGIYYSTDPARAAEGLEDFLSIVTVLGLDEEVCLIFGRENARLRKAGQIIEDFDLLIAATCLHYDLKLLTNNLRHFQRIEGLEIISTEPR
ncbi:type II toxin-antitoxin system VapC family toxin [Candidatus Poribacteria bacterium]